MSRFEKNFSSIFISISNSSHYLRLERFPYQGKLTTLYVHLLIPQLDSLKNIQFQTSEKSFSSPSAEIINDFAIPRYFHAILKKNKCSKIGNSILVFSFRIVIPLSFRQTEIDIPLRSIPHNRCRFARRGFVSKRKTVSRRAHVTE